MPARRTKPGFLSDNEFAREQKRTQHTVRGLLTSTEFEKKSSVQQVETKPNLKVSIKAEDEIVCIDSSFWASDKGLIVKAIVLNRAYNREAILQVTGLSDAQYRNAATALFQDGLLLTYEKINGNLCVARELYCQCKRFFKRS